MFKLIQIRPEGSDCTAPYDVELNGKYTVEQFIYDVLKDKREWGYIGINDGKSIFGNPNCEFRYGELLSSLPTEFLKMQVTKARASGGWSRMDYILTVDVVNDVFVEITEHYGICLEDVYGNSGYVVYENGRQGYHENYIAKFKNRQAAINECRYLERCYDERIEGIET